MSIKQKEIFMNKKIMASMLLVWGLFSLNAFSQTNDSGKIDPGVVGPVKIHRDYSYEQINRFNDLLDKQDYVTFYDVFQNTDVSGDNYIKFLLDRQRAGHVPLYWLMANYYATIKNESETHKWLYIATIMTQQDAALCSDQTSKFASQKLMRAFPLAPDLVRITPQYTPIVMPEVIYFIQNLKSRSNPIWACNFGQGQLAAKGSALIPQTSWDSQRKKIFKQYTDRFMQ